MQSIHLRGHIKNPALIFMHGLLGRGDDFFPMIDILEKDFYCISLDLPGHGTSPYYRPACDAILKTIGSLSLSSAYGVGYSLGGRILMQLQETLPFLKKTFFLSAHLGVEKEQKKEQRAKEDLWLARLNNMSLDEFLTLWYREPLFISLQNNKALLSKVLQKRRHQNKEGLASMIDQFRLSEQPIFSPEKGRHILLYGQWDEKYKELYRQKNSQADVVEISQSGHAVHLENPSECAEKIRMILAKEKEL